MPLTVLQIAALHPLDKSYRKADEKGLYLEVFPNGSKLWRFKYRIGGKEKRLRDHVRKTTETTGEQIAYSWSREVGATIGSHVHILLHLPAGYVWHGRLAMRWLERISGKRYKQGASKTTRIGGTARAHENNPAVYLSNLVTIVGYTIKGTSPDGAQTLQLERVKAQRADNR